MHQTVTRSVRVLVVQLTALALLAVPGLAGQQSDSLSAQVDRLFATWDRPDSPGAAVLVVHDGQVVHRKGYGSANLEYEIPITPETVFDVASVSKQFTGMAIAMLVESGAISLDDDVRTYIPELPDFGTPITIQHLVHHTSGIRDWPGTLAVAGWQMDDVISFDQILTMAYHQRDLNFEPGARHLYSNTGYNLLAEVVSRVSGQSFREWTDEHLFQPLGMEHTHFHDDHTELVPHVASAYQPSLHGYRTVANGLTALGSSSLYTTLDDLEKWVRNFDDHAVGGTPVIERMRTRGVLNSGDTIPYAYGLSIGEYRGLPTASHGGSWAGFRTYVLHFPEQRFGVVLLGNFGTFAPARPAHQIADLYLAEQLAPRETAQSAPESGHEVQVDGALLREYEGLYKLGPGWFVTITREGDGLTTQATNEHAFPMTARSEAEFYVPAYRASMTFRRGADGTITHVDYRDITAMRVEPWSPTLDDLRQFEGIYDSDELETTYTITLRDSTLVARHRRHQDVELTPMARDEFRGSAWFASGVEFVRDERGAVTELMISSGRVLHLRFVKR